MSARAVFVDAVGHIKEQMLQVDVAHVSFPVYRPVKMWATEPDYPVPCETTTFERIGRLSDQRVVYGQVEAKLDLWVANYHISEEAQRVSLVDMVDLELQGWLAKMASPVVLLHTQHSDGEMINHHFEGVGRQP